MHDEAGANLLGRQLTSIGQADALRLRLLAQELTAIALDGCQLCPPSYQHQKNKGGDEIEINEPLLTREPTVERAGVSPDNPNRNREVDVHRTLAQRPNGASNKVRATHQQAQCAKSHGEQAEERR